MTGVDALGAGLRPEGLPAGYRWRPATTADADAVHRLVAAYEREVHGRAETAADRITAELTLPGLRPEHDTLLVYDATGAPA
ncbi:hypothetical protein ACWC2T_12895 [Streptomyces sp. NPDC001393]